MIDQQKAIQEVLGTARTALAYDLPNDEYHAMPGISSSTIKSVGNCPAYAYAKHFDPDREPFEPTPAMKFGSAAHKMVLEPDDFFSEYAVAPQNINRRTNAGKEEWAEFQESAKGKEVITVEDYDKLIVMRDAVYQHDEAASLMMEPIEVEYSGFWKDEDTGLLVKYRPDAGFSSNSGFLIDYKTTSDASPDAFSRSIYNFGYHISAAHYIEGERRVRDAEHNRFIFLAQETKPPYLVAVYVLDHASLQQGWEQRMRHMRTLAHCLETGDWPGIANDQITEISIPYWAFDKD